MKKILTVLLLISVMALAYATDVELGWDEADGDVTGFTIYWGTSSGNYTNSEGADFQRYGTNYFGTVSNLTAGTTYYFAVTAYDDMGDVSPYSAEISYTIPTSAGNITHVNLRIK